MPPRGHEEGHPHKYTANSSVAHTVVGHGKIQSSDCSRISFIYVSTAMGSYALALTIARLIQK